MKRHHLDTELFDVGIVAWFFFKHEEETYGPVAKRVGFDEFFKVRLGSLVCGWMGGCGC